MKAKPYCMVKEAGILWIWILLIGAYLAENAAIAYMIGDILTFNIHKTIGDLFYLFYGVLIFYSILICLEFGDEPNRYKIWVIEMVKLAGFLIAGFIGVFIILLILVLTIYLWQYTWYGKMIIIGIGILLAGLLTTIYVKDKCEKQRRYSH